MSQTFLILLLSSLSMSLGWRIRGQFGHEAGAAIAGGLGAMSIALLSGRRAWWPRVPYFGLFGALGWAFGGSMSYMKVVGFCHSSDPATVLYGFAGLFLIGFLWAAVGGAGTALPAILDSEKLSALFPPLIWVFTGWLLQDIGVDLYKMAGGGSLNWRDTDWLAATVAAVAALALWLRRKRMDMGISLILSLSLGWWAGMALFVVLLGWQLNPPRGDNWAGCIGLFAGLIWFCRRYGLRDVLRASLTCGFLGGAGFTLGQIIKLAFEATGPIVAGNSQGGWHSIMEWIHGLFFGAALAVAILPLARSAPDRDSRDLPRWTKAFSVFVLLWIIPYLNFRRSPEHWVKFLKTLPERFGGIAMVSEFRPSLGFLGWMEIVFLVFGAMLIWMLRRNLHLFPSDPLAQGQLLFIAYLWAFVFISFAHVIVEFSAFIAGIQLAITLQGIVCMALMLLGSEREPVADMRKAVVCPGLTTPRFVAAGVAVALLMSVSGFGLKRVLFGDAFVGFFYKNHIRFGPDNTNSER